VRHVNMSLLFLFDGPVAPPPLAQPIIVFSSSSLLLRKSE
jgi:hypothetical protein